MSNSDNNLTRLFAPKEPGADAGSTFRVPKVACTLTVTLDELEPCDLNPRQSVNPLYDDIKASILTKGLDHPPNITVRPGGSRYMVRDGGNTRLQILNELWAATQDSRFYQFECSFKPWISDIDTLASHMVENESRGEMLFIDRALAAVRMRDFLREEGILKKDSVRELAESITRTGWTLHNQHLSYMLYAAEELFPYLPSVFWAGLGRPSVKLIRKLHAAAQDYWQQKAAEQPALTNEQFTAVWQDALRESDSDSFVLEDLQDHLYPKLEAQLGVTGIGMVAGSIDAILFDRRVGLHTTGTTPPAIHPPETTGGEPAQAAGFPVSGAGTVAAHQPHQQHTPPPAAPPFIQRDSQSPRVEPTNDAGTDASAPSTQEYLIQRIHAQVQEIVAQFELDRWIQLSGSGAGYSVNRDFEPLSAVQADHELFQRGALHLMIEFEAATRLSPEELYQLPSQLCDQLYAGRASDMLLAQSALLQARLNPDMLGADAAGTAFAALRALELLIYQLNHHNVTKNATKNH